MPLQLAQHDEGVVVSLDDVVHLLPCHVVRAVGLVRQLCRSVCMVGRRGRGAERRAWPHEGHRGVLRGPLEEGERLASAHVLVHVQHDDVVVRLHLEGDAPRVRLAHLAQDEFDLHIGHRPAVRAQRQRVRGVRGADHVAPLVLVVDSQHADEHVDGRQAVGKDVREGHLCRAVCAPRQRLLVGIENVDDEHGHAGDERRDERQRDHDRRWVDRAEEGAEGAPQKRRHKTQRIWPATARGLSSPPIADARAQRQISAAAQVPVCQAVVGTADAARSCGPAALFARAGLHQRRAGHAVPLADVTRRLDRVPREGVVRAFAAGATHAGATRAPAKEGAQTARGTGRPAKALGRVRACVLFALGYGRDAAQPVHWCGCARDEARRRRRVEVAVDT